MDAPRLTAADRRAAMVLCLLVAARDRTAVSEEWMLRVTGDAHDTLNVAIRDLRRAGHCIVRWPNIGWQLWEAAE